VNGKKKPLRMKMGISIPMNFVGKRGGFVAIECVSLKNSSFGVLSMKYAWAYFDLKRKEKLKVSDMTIRLERKRRNFFFQKANQASHFEKRLNRFLKWRDHFGYYFMVTWLCVLVFSWFFFEFFGLFKKYEWLLYEKEDIICLYAWDYLVW
jgi:hypothetical protein